MLKDKDFVYIDYVGKIKDTGEVFDTTIEEEAKKANIYNKETKYAPKLVILGEHNIIQGLEEALYQMNPGEEKEIDVPPEKGYGPRDNTKVKTISLGELKRQGINPYPNMVVRLSNGSLAVIKSVSGGRVILDLNHPLAGKQLVYKVKIVKVLDNDTDKIKALLERWFGESYVDKLNMEIDEKKNVKFTLSKDLYLLEDIQIRKYMLAKDIITYIFQESNVTFIENYNKDIFNR